MSDFLTAPQSPEMGSKATAKKACAEKATAEKAAAPRSDSTTGRTGVTETIRFGAS